MGEIPSWVAPYVGIPYKHAAYGHDGADCWGLIVLIWREVFGHELPDYAGPHWKKGADAAEIGEAIAAEVKKYQPVEPGQEREGDGIILRLRGEPLHIGLVVAPGWMIHAHETAASCVENYNGMAWRRRIIGFRRHEPKAQP